MLGKGCKGWCWDSGVSGFWVRPLCTHRRLDRKKLTIYPFTETMWTYFGSKTNIVSFYPAPVHDIIIEPFAGTARYSLEYWQKEVVICDRYKVLIDLWKWLQKCTEGDILGIPTKVQFGQSIYDLSLPCPEALTLYGFLSGKGLERPRIHATAWVTTHRQNWYSYTLKRIAGNLHKIRHWTIIHGDYSGVLNQRATWFIDPPYQEYGDSYVYGSSRINYNDLANYCLSRSGQVIVCEGHGAKWLPFEFLTQVNRTARGKGLREMIWYRGNQASGLYSPMQSQLF